MTGRAKWLRDVIDVRRISARVASLALGCGHHRRFAGRGELPKRSHCPTCEQLDMIASQQTHSVFMTRADTRTLDRRVVAKALEDE